MMSFGSGIMVRPTRLFHSQPNLSTYADVAEAYWIFGRNDPGVCGTNNLGDQQDEDFQA